MLTADTNLFIHAADPDSPFHPPAREFFNGLKNEESFVLCELVLVELYMQLRNPAVFRKPYSAKEAAEYCCTLKKNPSWRCVDYDPAVAVQLWRYADSSRAGFRHIIDARLALTLLHHGVDQFATVNVKHFKEFAFTRVWNPLGKIG
ncbi:MAG: PIN domain-containing protein [Verrucomicrobiaceae bacterium]|nr:MAG: PIN domain-containing protein [Verrucomicrobiaceae bacterium]